MSSCVLWQDYWYIHSVYYYGPKSTARLDKIKDNGVYFDAKLDFKDHMHEKINKAYMMLGLINCNFKHMTIPTFVALYKSMSDPI